MNEFEVEQKSTFPAFFPDPTDESACSKERIEQKRCPLIFGRRQCKRENEERKQIAKLCENDRQLRRSVMSGEDQCRPRKLLQCTNPGCLQFNWRETRRQTRCARRSEESNESSHSRRRL